jgi:uncharacterized protein (TIGR02722 family)
LALLVLTMAACGGPGTGRVGEGKIHYEDPQAEETVTIDYGSTDLQSTAEHMAQSLLASAGIAEASSPPVIRLREVRNYTDEHIDTKGITDKIRVQLLNSGKVRFLADKEGLGQVLAERDLTEQLTGRTANDPLAEADYIITGAVRSIRKSSDKFRDVFYQFTLEMTDPQSGEIRWAEEKEIRKTLEKGFWGW